jgi:hypothetical protein
VTAVDDDWDEDDDPYEPDDSDDQDEPDYDYYDDDPGGSWGPEDYLSAKAYYEEAGHRDEVHGGGDCDCRPPLAVRASQLARDVAGRLAGPWVRLRLKIAARHPWTVRAGGIEVTVRLHAGRGCGACGARGWFYSLDRSRDDDRPPGYNGVSLCGCGSAIGQLAGTRRYLRDARGEPPF